MIKLTNFAIAATETGRAAQYGEGNPFLEWAWLIVIVPFLAFLAIVFFGKRLPRRGGEIAVGAMAFVAVYAAVLFIMNVTGGVEFVGDPVEVGKIGTFAIEWGWVVDGLSSMMYLVVGLLAFLIFTYALGYMEGDVRVTWFFAAFTLFAGSMLLLVSAPNLIQLIVGWEGVGLSSYLLIGHYWEDKENSSAGMKAFYVNKVADIGLIIGAFVLAIPVGSFRISDILTAVVDNPEAIETVAMVGAVLLFIGAMGKSAQFPFHVWLPDAMAGPTPVSALMHAATMVTAGVYLVARMFPLYAEMAADARGLVITIGAITLIIAGLLAVVQDDIKKVLAYSTVSQLGYMVAALGAGAYTAGLFHLWTHAFFKGLLFLGAGSVIHSVHSNNMSDMGGLRKPMPVTFSTFVAGTLALAGIFPLAGFFSKDEVLAAFNHEGYTAVLVIGIIGAFITAFYMARTVFLTFYGTYKGHGHPHESPKVMTVPMMILAGLAVVGGWVNIPGLYTGFTEWVGTRAHPIAEHHAESFDWPVLAIGLTAALLGIVAGYLLYFKDKQTQLERDTFRIPLLWPLLEHKYYLDDLYLGGIVNPIKGPIARFVNWTNSYIFDGIVNGAGFLARAVAGVVYGVFDQRGIDLALNGLAFTTDGAGGKTRLLQTGKVQQYAGATVIGAALLVIGFVIFR
ncbi:MAG: NADH-quinone oxidoreductase subunit L [Acidimicrobiia bacterium]|nr:NADH-quinone oxidoreductase subunit L [Acidimicrobiia bacterium]MDH3396314.1 NADH-quinone oxidoreductase subunit L [Acidimicrobiia bacterium]